MKITAYLLNRETAHVSEEPSLLERIILKREATDYRACRLHDINGGFVWLEDHPPNRPVRPEVLREIERAVAEHVWQGIWSRLGDTPDR